MKKRIKNTIIILSAVLMTVSLNAQNDGILSGVKETKQYDALDLINMERELTTFANLLRLSGLNVSAEMAEGYTIFPPTNQAFYEMSIEDFAYLTNPKNKAELVKFVKYHILPKKVKSYDFNNSQVVSVGFNKDIPVNVDTAYNIVYIGGAKVIKADIEASNAMIHVVNGIVNPVDGVTDNSK